MVLSKRKLLWTSSSSIPFLRVPSRIAESLRDAFPQVQVVVGRDAETILREMEDCEIFVSWTLKPEQFARARKLRWIHSPATGVTQLWVPGLAESAVVVTNGRTVHAVPVAEHTLSLILALARRLPRSFRYQAESRWGQAESWEGVNLPTEINGKTLGLVGYGSIGREVAARAKAWGMRVEAVKRDPSEGTEFAERVYSPERLDALLAEADYLVLAAPDTPETRRLIGGAELRRMKPTAFLVNVSRGSLLDTEALVRALESGAIAGAALDVTDPEPLPAEHRLWKLPNVLITPHLAGATDRFWQREADLLRENLRRYLSGEPLLNLVDKSKGY